MDKLKLAEQSLVHDDIPEFKSGDTVNVHYRVREGDKERIQQFQGVVISRKGTGPNQTFIVRKISAGNIGVERIFPLYSPFIAKIEVKKEGDVRRSKLFYLRDRRGKAARIKEKDRRMFDNNNQKAAKKTSAPKKEEEQQVAEEEAASEEE
jgi:large subunit ribosomal protein L19